MTSPWNKPDPMPQIEAKEDAKRITESGTFWTGRETVLLQEPASCSSFTGFSSVLIFL